MQDDRIGGAVSNNKISTSYNQPVWNHINEVANTKTTTTTTTTTPKVNTYVPGSIKSQDYIGSGESAYGGNPHTNNAGVVTDNSGWTPSTQVAGSAYQTPSLPRDPGTSYSPKISSNDILDYYKSMTNDALDDVINSIMSRLNVSRGQYDALKNDVNNEFDDQIAQSEVQRYKSKRSLRNSLSNRGQLNSGLGRYEMLFNDAQAQNRISAINSNRSKALNDIQIALQQAEAQANSDIASAKNSANSQILQYALNNL